MKTLFLKDDRLREIILDRNKEIERLLLKGTLKGTCSIRLSTSGVNFGWEIIDNEDGYKVEERFGAIAEKKSIQPSGTITALKDWFKPIDQEV